MLFTELLICIILGIFIGSWISVLFVSTMFTRKWFLKWYIRKILSLQEYIDDECEEYL